MQGYSDARFPTAEFSTATKTGLLLLTANFNQLKMQLKYAHSDKERTTTFEWNSVVDFSLAMDNLSILVRFEKDRQTEDLLIASDYVSVSVSYSSNHFLPGRTSLRRFRSH